jgi:diguanylate cyclase (GGDEF)-like protein
MIAAGQPLGLLHVRPGVRDSGLGSPALADALDSCRRLAESTASQVALTLTNVKLQETLRGQAIRDPLTGLFNRRYLEESLERELRRAARDRKPLGVIMMDIDHFKPFNDAHGHELGDLLLAALGNFLRAQVREQDIVCRYGGEEFTIILPEASLEATLQRAQKIRDGVRRVAVPSERGPVGSLTVSLGVAAYPDHGSTSRALLSAADAALYRAKEQGRDRPAIATGASDGE